jgi:hypothetical protein
MTNEIMIQHDVQDIEPATTAAGIAPARVEGHESLFPAPDSESFRNRWHDIQGGFVDEPREAVQKADELVVTVIKRLADAFSNERAGLEADWAKGNDVSTEDLRQALRRYRSFFDRLLSV